MEKLKRLTREHFQSLTEYQYASTIWTREKEWWVDIDERVLGVVVLDLTDKDWSWVVLGRDEVGKFRFVDLKVSLHTQQEARRQLLQKLVPHA